jgi:hypothetical protein
MYRVMYRRVAIDRRRERVDIYRLGPRWLIGLVQGQARCEKEIVAREAAWVDATWSDDMAELPATMHLAGGIVVEWVLAGCGWMLGVQRGVEQPVE